MVLVVRRLMTVRYKGYILKAVHNTNERAYSKPPKREITRTVSDERSRFHATNALK
jgi:hypothetical protein